jgi:hypothetical protein
VAELAASAPERVDCDVLAAPRSAERDPVGCRDVECLAMATAEGPALDVVAALANSSCQQAVGNDVTFVVNRNINRTNICYPGRRFCGSAQRKGDADGDTLSCCDAQPSSGTNFGARTSLAVTSRRAWRKRKKHMNAIQITKTTSPW